jgi:hypothetical protein
MVKSALLISFFTAAAKDKAVSAPDPGMVRPEIPMGDRNLSRRSDHRVFVTILPQEEARLPLLANLFPALQRFRSGSHYCVSVVPAEDLPPLVLAAVRISTNRPMTIRGTSARQDLSARGATEA